MIFNFFLGNQRHEAIKGMVDTILPIYHGLSALGHHVILYGLSMQTAPVVNVLFEDFADDQFTSGLLAIKADAGDRFRFGVVCTEDLHDPLAPRDPMWPHRRFNLLQVLPKADFVWTLLPEVPVYESFAGAGKVALLEYGFSERFLNPRVHAQRDIDFVMYGDETPYRKQVVDKLQARGLKGVTTARQIFPDFVTADLLSRSKVVLDLRRGPGVGFPSPTRICKALHSRTFVVAENVGDSAISNLYRYIAAYRYDELADRAEQVIRSGRAAELGEVAQAQFKAETSMRANMARAISLPAFQRFAA
jgi:hypothetical protein